MTALLYALRDVFAENPKAPPVINGIEFALHFKEDNPRPMCRKLPRLSINEKEHMSKDALQMLINDVIEFSDSDWATVPVFAKKADGSLRFAIDYRYCNSCCVVDSQGTAKYDGHPREPGNSRASQCVRWGVRLLGSFNEAGAPQVRSVPCLDSGSLAPGAASQDGVWLYECHSHLRQTDEQDLRVLQKRQADAR